MKNITQEVIKFLTTNRAKTFYWTTLNGFLGIMIIQLGELEWVYAPIIIALLSGLTKFINRDILGRV
jgi:hypothetical protein